MTTPMNMGEICLFASLKSFCLPRNRLKMLGGNMRRRFCVFQRWMEHIICEKMDKHRFDADVTPREPIWGS